MRPALTKCAYIETERGRKSPGFFVPLVQKKTAMYKNIALYMAAFVIILANRPYHQNIPPY